MSDIFNLYVEAGSPHGDDQPQSANRWAADEIQRLRSELTTARDETERLRARASAILDIANKLADAVSKDMDAAGGGEECAAVSALYNAHEDYLVFRENDPDAESQAWLLRKQAEAVEGCGPKMLAEEVPESYMWDLSDVNDWLKEEAQRLRQRADKAEKAGG